MFRPRLRLARPVLCCVCSGGPLGPSFLLAPGCHPERSEGSAFLRVALHEMRITDLSPSRFSNIPTFKHFNAPLLQITSHQSHFSNSFTIRTYAKPTCNPFRIRTSKTQHLKPFRMNTSEKTGRGEGSHLSSQRVSIFHFRVSIFHFRVSIFEFRSVLFRCHYSLLTAPPPTFLLRPAASVVGFPPGTWRTEVSLAAPPDHLHSLSGLEGRRSTRIDRTVPLVVLGQTKTGLSFQEKTATV